MECYRYTSRKLLNIADNYEEYDPETSQFGSAWYRPEQTASLIEFKADFDLAHNHLPKMFIKLVFNEEWGRQWDRMEVLSKMAKILNGENTP